MVALETHSAEQRLSLPSSAPTSPERSSSRLSQSTSKLRYAAYEPPKVTSKLRRLSSSSSRSNSTLGIRRHDSEESLSRTFTPGELALVAGRQQLQEFDKVGDLGFYCGTTSETVIVPCIYNVDTTPSKRANHG